MATALYALVLATNNSAALHLLRSPPPSPAQPTATSRWINGLWFTSLFLSLSVALLCILVKQWLGEYTARTTASATNRLWARRRMFYFVGLKEWHLAGLISVLPLLLHLALFLFFGGLVAFLCSFDRGIGAWLAVASGALLLFYAVTTALPFWYPECPTSTPLVNQMRNATIRVVVFSLRWCLAVLAAIIRRARTAYAFVHRHEHESDPEVNGPPLSHTLAVLKKTTDRMGGHDAQSFLHAYLDSHGDEMDAAVFHWLILSVSDSDPSAVGYQAIGAIRPCSRLATLVRSDDILGASTFDLACTNTNTTWSVTELARIARSMLCLHGQEFDGDAFPIDFLYWTLKLKLRYSNYPDTRLLGASITGFDETLICREAADWRNSASPSLLSTAMLLLHCPDIRVLHALRILLCLRMSELSSDDWACAFRALRWTLPVCPRHSGDRCTFICRAEVLAQLTSPSNASQFDRQELDIVSQLIVHVLEECVPTGTGISISPLLLEFLASNLCLRTKFSSRALHSVSLIISEPFDWVPYDFPALSTLNRALSNIMYVTKQQHTGKVMIGSSVSCLYRHLLATGVGSMAHTGDIAPRLPLATLLGLILRRPEGSNIYASPWDLIHDLEGYAYYHLSLAAAVTAALCTLPSNKKDTTSLVQSFFSLPHKIFREAVVQTHLWVEQSDEFSCSLFGEFLRLVRHCNELQPWWWPALSEVVTADGNEGLVDFVATVETALAQENEIQSDERPSTAVVHPGDSHQSLLWQPLHCMGYGFHREGCPLQPIRLERVGSGSV